MPPPGGDFIGRRRLDPHLDALRALGAQIEVDRAATDVAPRRPARVRVLHGRGQRDGDREHADGRGADARHHDDQERRLASRTCRTSRACWSRWAREIDGIGSNVLTVHGSGG